MVPIFLLLSLRRSPITLLLDTRAHTRQDTALLSAKLLTLGQIQASLFVTRLLAAFHAFMLGKPCRFYAHSENKSTYDNMKIKSTNRHFIARVAMLLLLAVMTLHTMAIPFAVFSNDE